MALDNLENGDKQIPFNGKHDEFRWSFPRRRLFHNWQNYAYWCFCHSGLDPESIFFQGFTLLDAGSVIPGLIRDRHDRHQ